MIFYPNPTYTPNKIIAGCIAVLVIISLIAWFIQSWQTRFYPRRPCFLLLISHLTIFIELIIRASVSKDEQDSKIFFSIINSLLIIGQRMIIVSNFSFVLEIHHEKSRLSRGIFIGTILAIIISGCLMIPANLFAFDLKDIETSFLFRQLSTSILLAITICFYPILYWSKTIKNMTKFGVILILISSILCLILAIFNLVQSMSDYLFDTINDYEGWFYGFQMTPIILAHFTWSILHPKRSLKDDHLQRLMPRDSTLLNEQRTVEIL